MENNNCQIIEADDRNFENIIMEANKPVLVDFWSPTCAPCKMQAPIIEEAAKHYGDEVIFVKVNIAESSQIATHLNIRSIPTIAIFKGTKIFDVSIGLANLKILKRMIDRATGNTLWKRLFGKK